MERRFTKVSPDLVLGAILCALYLPFLNKAIHIDDFYVLAFAKMLGFNPLHANATDYHYMGDLIHGFKPFDDNSPILIPYLIKLLTTIFGANEVALHLAFLIFPALSLVGLIGLNRVLFPDVFPGESSSGLSSPGRAGVRTTTSRLAPIFILTAPAFLVNSQNLMRDVPALSFLVFAVFLFAKYIEGGHPPLALLGGLALTLAVLTQFPPLVFIPLLAVYALLKKRFSLWMAAGLALPVAVLIGLLASSYGLLDRLAGVREGESSLWWLANRSRLLNEMPGKVLSLLAHLGASTALVSAVYLFRHGSRGRPLIVLGTVAALSIAASRAIAGYEGLQGAILASTVALGAFALCEAAACALSNAGGMRNARNAFLLLWIVVVCSCLVLVYPLGAARYVLMLLPPIVLLMLNRGLPDLDERRHQRTVVYAALSLAVLFGFASAYSDYKFADGYRRFAANIGRFRTEAEKPFDIWYIGEWGMRHYMDAVGARYLTGASNAPQEGDLVVLPRMLRLWTPSPRLMSRLSHFGTREYSSGFRLKLFHGYSNAGFYGHYWGFLPFSFARVPDEIFDIYIVSY